MGCIQATLVANYNFHPLCNELNVYWSHISTLIDFAWDYFILQGIPFKQIDPQKRKKKPKNTQRDWNRLFDVHDHNNSKYTS